MIESGLPPTFSEHVSIGKNGTVTISSIENSLCQELIPVFHLKKYGDRKLKCFGIIPVTPQKADSDIQPSGVTQREGDALVPPSVDRPQGEGGDAFTPPVLPTQGASCSLPAVEGRKSVLELVTDFSSCISGLSSSEGEPGSTRG